MTGERDILVLYHDDSDGFGAAWAAWKHLGETARYVAVNYGWPVPDCGGVRALYILDFCYPAKAMRQLAGQVERLVVLDHHKTAKAALAGIQGPQYAHVAVEYNQNHSGAVMAWHHFYPEEPVPVLLVYVEDRDLWRWKLPESRQIDAVIRSKVRGFGQWTALHRHLQAASRGAGGFGGWPTLVECGQAILDMEQRYVERIAATAWQTSVDGHEVIAANAPILQSEVGRRLLLDWPKAAYAATYADRDQWRTWNLRSRPGGVDVAEIARRRGGGGHTHAAGFVMKKEAAAYEPAESEGRTAGATAI